MKLRQLSLVEHIPSVDKSLAEGIGLTALHEASHAVVSWALQVPVERLSLRPGRLESGRTHDAVVTHPNAWLDPVVNNPWGHKEQMFKLATINFSGLLVTHGLGLQDIGSQGDVNQAWKMMSYFAEFRVEREKAAWRSAGG